MPPAGRNARRFAEAYLRRTHPRDTDRPDRIVSTLVGASLALWTGLLIAAL